MELRFRKVYGWLQPADDDTAAYVAKQPMGAVLRGEFKRERNARFHAKFFALLKVGFDAWEPPEATYKGLPVQKDFERFRKDCTIAAGFYEPVVALNGEVRAEAHSIAFGSMSEDRFEELYSKVADVLLQRVLANYTRKDLDRVVNEILGFV